MKFYKKSIKFGWSSFGEKFRQKKFLEGHPKIEKNKIRHFQSQIFNFEDGLNLIYPN